MALRTSEPHHHGKIISFEERKYEMLWRFWFGEIAATKEYFDEKMDLWFGKDEAFDREIRDRFVDWFEHLENWDLENWKKYPRGTLALIILTDQISRNAFRGTKRAFQYDHIARDIAHQVCQSGKDANYELAERLFLYMPLEHSENLKDQELSVKKFEELLREVAPSLKPTFEEAYVYAVRHRDIIAKFGRFPHRNAILGRQTSPDEQDFLKQAGSSF